MKKNPVGTILVLVAVALSFGGICLPFYTVDVFGEHMSVSLLNADGIQPLAIVWMAFAVLTLIFALAGKKVPVIIFGILTACGLFLSYTLNNSQLDEYGELGALINKGIGNTLSLVGAIAMVVAAIIYAATTKKDA